MIESGEFFMSEWAVSLVIAAGVWLVGYLAFIRGADRPVFVGTDSLPMKSEEDANKFNLGFLLDLVKWAEMLLAELEDARRTHEKKALLLVSLAFAAAGYLYSGVSGLGGFWEAWSAIVYVSFGAVALLGIMVVDFIGYWPRGQHPSAFHEEFLARTSPNNKERKWALYGMLEIYRGYIDENRKVIAHKYAFFHAAKYCFVFGAGGLLSAALKTNGQIADICRWLAEMASQ